MSTSVQSARVGASAALATLILLLVAQPAQLHRPLHPSRRAPLIQSEFDCERRADGRAHHGPVLRLHAGRPAHRLARRPLSPQAAHHRRRGACGAWPPSAPPGSTAIGRSTSATPSSASARPPSASSPPPSRRFLSRTRPQPHSVHLLYRHSCRRGARLRWPAGKSAQFGDGGPFFICAIPGLIIAALYGFRPRARTRSRTTFRATADRATVRRPLPQSRLSHRHLRPGHAHLRHGRHLHLDPRFLHASSGFPSPKPARPWGAITVIDGIPGTAIGAGSPNAGSAPITALSTCFHSGASL